MCYVKDRRFLICLHARLLWPQDYSLCPILVHEDQFVRKILDFPSEFLCLASFVPLRLARRYHRDRCVD